MCDFFLQTDLKDQLALRIKRKNIMNDQLNSVPKTKGNFIFWTCFSLLILLEYCLFRNYVLREIANYYPTNFDQAAYLPITYKLYEDILTYGIKPIWMWADNLNGFTTLLFPVQAALSYLFFGASRITALSINFGFFVLLQGFTLKVIKDISYNHYIAFLILGLLLLTNTIYGDSGSIVDFRMDFIALCLYGITILCVMRSDFFQDRKWSLITALFAILLCLTRIITFFYILPIFTAFFCYLLIEKKYLAKTNKTHFINLRQKSQNILIILTMLLIVMVPLLLKFRKLFHDYYIVGHITGTEKIIRAHLEEVTDWYSNLIYYPNSIIRNHLGCLFIFISIFCIIVFFLIQNNKQHTSTKISKDFNQGLLFFSLTILIPVFLLTIDFSKSPIVGGIVVTPITLLISWLVIWLYQKGNSKYYKDYILAFLCAAVLLIGFGNYLAHFAQHGPLYKKENISELTKMYDDIGDYAATTLKKEKILIGYDQVNDYLTNGSLETLYYERHHNFITFNSTLGGRITPIDKKRIIKELSNTDIVILNKNEKYKNEAPYPFNITIKPLRHWLRNFVEKKFTKLNTYNIFGENFNVYIPPVTMNIEGITPDGWITNSGILIYLHNKALNKISKIILSGTSPFTYSHKLNISATYILIDGSKTKLYSNISTVNGKYRISISLPKIISKQIYINVTFSDFFVPNKINASPDRRKLVMREPELKNIISR